MPKERERFFDHFSYFRKVLNGLKCSFFDESLKYLLYNFSKLFIHLLHHKSLPKISLNFVNLISNDKTKK